MKPIVSVLIVLVLAGAIAFLTLRALRREAAAPPAIPQARLPAPVAPSPAAEAAPKGGVPAPAAKAGSRAPSEEELGKAALKALFGKGGSAKDDSIPLEEAIRRLLDPEGTPEDRGAQVRRLAQAGTPEALAALREALASGPSYLKAAVAEALGRWRGAESKEILETVLTGEDLLAARGAARGLAVSGLPEATGLLAGVLGDPARPEGVRDEAARCLGGIDSAAACEALQGAWPAVAAAGGDLPKAVLDGLGSQPFSRTGRFFAGILDAPGTDGETRVAALEALGGSSAEAGDFLLERARREADPAARAAAAWALGSLDDSPPGATLLGLLDQEQAPSVRRALYEAVAAGGDIPAEGLSDRVLAEGDPEARLAGFDLLARASRGAVGGDQAAAFDGTAVAELVETALGDADGQRRLRAVGILKAAGTPAALQGLERIAGSQDPRTAEAAGKALTRPR